MGKRTVKAAKGLTLDKASLIRKKSVFERQVIKKSCF